MLTINRKTVNTDSTTGNFNRSGSIVAWNGVTGEMLPVPATLPRVLRGAIGKSEDCYAISPKFSYMISDTYELIAWDTKTGEIIKLPKPLFESSFHSVIVSADCTKVGFLTIDGNVIVYDETLRDILFELNDAEIDQLGLGLNNIYVLSHNGNLSYYGDNESEEVFIDQSVVSFVCNVGDAVIYQDDNGDLYAKDFCGTTLAMSENQEFFDELNKGEFYNYGYFTNLDESITDGCYISTLDKDGNLTIHSSNDGLSKNKVIPNVAELSFGFEDVLYVDKNGNLKFANNSQVIPKNVESDVRECYTKSYLNMVICS